MKFMFIKVFFLSLSLFFNFFAYSNKEKNLHIIVATDFDGTVTQIAGARWLTAVDLSKIDKTKDLLVVYAVKKRLAKYGLTIDDLPYELEISQEEDLYFRDKFAKADGFITDYSALELPPIPGLKGREKKSIIIPGLYKMEYRRSFRENRQLIEDYEKSKKLAEEKNIPLNEIFNMGLDLINNNIEKDYSEIKIHTARGQDSETFYELLKRMQKDGFIKGSAKDLEKIKVHSFSHLSGSRYGDNFKNRKIELANETLKSLKPFITNNPKAEVHIVFAEDELSYIYEINELFRKESKSTHLRKVHMHVLFTGPSKFLKDLNVQNNQRFITYTNGSQSATSKEYAELLGLPLKRVDELNRRMNQLNKDVSTCRATFEKGNVK